MAARQLPVRVVAAVVAHVRLQLNQFAKHMVAHMGPRPVFSAIPTVPTAAMVVLAAPEHQPTVM